MPALKSFDYAIVRVVPHVERGERINVGAILFCRELAFLGARVVFDVPRLVALSPDLDLAGVQAHLDVIPRVCQGGDEAGPIGRLAQAERFHWLVAPRSTVVQPSCVHSGLCADPAAALRHLFATMVEHPGAGAPPLPGDAADQTTMSATSLVITPQPRVAEAQATLDQALHRGRGLRELRQAISLALRALRGELPEADDTSPNA